MNEDPDQDDVNHGIALAELVSYIEEARMDYTVTPVFKLIYLATLYMTRLEQLVFLDSSGGTGNTFFINLILSSVRAEGKIVRQVLRHAYRVVEHSNQRSRFHLLHTSTTQSCVASRKALHSLTSSMTVRPPLSMRL